MATRESKLVVTLQDDVSKPARGVAEALAQAEKRVKEIASEMGGAGAGASDKFVSSLSRLKLGAADIDAVKAAWTDYTKVAGIAGAETSSLTRDQISGIRSWESATLSSLRAVMRERNAETASMRRVAAEQNEILAKQVERQKTFQKEMTSGVGGMVGMGLGLAGISGVKDVVKDAADLKEQQFKISQLNKSDPTEVPFTNALAAEVAKKYPNITQAEALKTYIEMRPNSLNQDGTVNQERARSNLMIASRMQTAGLALGVEITPEDTQNLVKAVEMSGRAGDPTALGKMFDAYIRAKQTFGTAISSDKIRDFVANAKSANFGIGDESFFWKNIARLGACLLNPGAMGFEA